MPVASGANIATSTTRLAYREMFAAVTGRAALELAADAGGSFAEGVVAAVKEVGLRVPLVVRLEGTNVDLGKEIIAKSNLNVTSADDLDDAAQKIVKAVKGTA